LRELSLGQAKVQPINAEAQVFQALALMKENGLTSLPLVDHGGHLVGSLSLSDVRL
jgi:CBS domain-containing protein